MTIEDFEFDWQREARTGVAEAVLCADKTTAQIEAIARDAIGRGSSLLFTRLSEAAFEQLAQSVQAQMDYDTLSQTAIIDCGLAKPVASDVLIVTAGTSDLPTALEAQRTLFFNGLEAELIVDCGVAGLWRLTDKLPKLKSAAAIIAVAGMEGALFPVLAGLVDALIVAVPRSTGYGVAAQGTVALGSALTCCSPGVVVVNIDNGFGAACALLKLRVLAPAVTRLI